jgi:hypothetical protein
VDQLARHVKETQRLSTASRAWRNGRASGTLRAAAGFARVSTVLTVPAWLFDSRPRRCGAGGGANWRAISRYATPRGGAPGLWQARAAA